MKSTLREEHDPGLIPKRFWSHVKSTSNSSRIPECVSYGGRFRNNVKDQSELFNTYFYDQFSSPSNYDIPVSYIGDKFSIFSQFKISISTIRNFLKASDANKAPGPDGIHGCWGDTGRYPLFTDALKLSTDYFFRAQTIHDTTLLHEAFVEQKTLNLEWYRNMNSITNMYNSNVSKYPSTNIRKGMHTLFCTKWVEAKNSSPKLDFYNRLKSEFCFEKYLLLTNYKYRNALTRLRISAHNLYIERGRYTRPPISRDNRVCMFCKNNLNILVVEDELHVINDCPLYKNAHFILRQTSVNCTNILNDIFVNQENNFQSNLLAGKLAYTIQETHNAFSHYYSNSQHAHQNTGGCIVM